jgi:hypothetical protein
MCVLCICVCFSMDVCVSALLFAVLILVLEVGRLCCVWW